ncbi:hypothetical protein [Actinoplanes octamycinicus]|uniref:hypothetical protein n=1 Tax=Actinoplanes octamycinicus TaxID=135948 RepID=UPI001EF34002|nr:hypothetical protein [Actinoplanes octamycinicus]
MSEPAPDPFFGQDNWSLEPPRPIVPVPATMSGRMRGRRVLTGLPGLGWRGDLRADEKVIQGSRTYVPIMPESEWYRAESERTEVFAALVAIDRVWVEELGVSGLGSLSAHDKPQPVSLDEPPRRFPTSAERATSLTGRRAVRLLEDGGEQRDLRATTELYISENGDTCARVANESDWYRWAWSGKFPQTLEVAANLLWLE